MKICVATTTFPRWEGDGQGAFVWEAVRAVANEGVDVRVVTMHAPGLPVHSRMQGVDVWRPRYWRPEKYEMLKREGGGLPIVWQRYPWARLQIVPFGLVHTLGIAAWSRGCDLVHGHWTLSAAAAVGARLIHHRPVLATLQGSDLFRVTASPIGASLTRVALAGCTHVTVLSRALARSAERVGVGAAKLTIIPNGVDTSVFTPLPRDERENTVLFVGSLIPRKGPEYLIPAFAEVLKTSPDTRLVMLGEGPQEAELKQLATELGISDRVVFLGFLPQEEVRRWMRRASVFVLPSIEEGLGVVLLEALASGTPIVASDVDGIPDVVTLEVGILTPARSPVALTTAINQVLSNPGRWSAYSEAARARAVEHYDWRHIAGQYLALYDRISAGQA